MNELKLGAFLDGFHSMAALEQVMRLEESMTFQFTALSWSGLKDKAGELLAQTKSGMPLAHASMQALCDEMLAITDDFNKVGSYTLGPERFSRLMSALRSVLLLLPAELRHRVTICLEPNESATWQLTGLGIEMNPSFQTVAVDFVESAKCLALGRSTAAVFHCMRILEAALRALRDRLGIESSARNWGEILQQIRDERIRRGGAKWEGNDLVQEIAAQLHAIKDVWRNATMHVEKTYTPPEATLIFELTSNLAKKISAGLSELPPK